MQINLKKSSTRDIQTIVKFRELNREFIRNSAITRLEEQLRKLLFYLKEIKGLGN